MNIRILALTALALLLGSIARADQPPMVFDHLTLEHGLSQSTVMDIHQDSQGFIWIATENGLNRYDGYEFKLYSRERGSPNGLGSDYVWAIDEDADGNLWFATEGGGVAVWDRRTDDFSSYRHNPDNLLTLSSDSIRNVLIDRSGRVWVATRNNGLNLLDPATGVVTRFLHDADAEESISSNNLFALLEDRDGNIWVGTDNGLNRYVTEDGRFERHDHVAELAETNILSLAQDSRGDIWIGTFEGGLHRLDPESNEVSVYRHDANDLGSISNDDVRAIFEDAEKRLWIGTASGLNLFNRIEGRFQRFQYESGNQRSLRDDYVMSIYQDHGGLLWVGTRSGGTSRWNPRSWSFGHYYRDWLEGAYVTSFADDERGNLWIGAVGPALSRLNLATGERVAIEQVAKNPQALADPRVMSLLSDRYEQLWIGTMNGGLSKLGTDGVIETFRYDANDEATIGADGVMALYEDSAGSIWIGTFGGGISLFDPESRRFQRTFGSNELDDSLATFRVTSIVEDVNGYIWIGTDSNGLVLLDRHRGVVKQYLHDPNDQTTLASNTIYALHIDNSDRIWIGTAGGGLDHIEGNSSDPESVRFVNFAQDKGLPNNVVYGIRPDDAGQLWLSTNHGLTRFDPANRSVKAFHKMHGLQDEEFNFGAHYKARDGRLVFGGMKGFNAFSPRKLQETKVQPRVVLTGIEVLNESVTADGSLSQLSQIELGHRDDIVSFEFAALDFTDPSRNLYAYKLEGFDQDFVNIGNLRRVSYTNLDAGRYVFRVRAASADSVWNHEGVALPIMVHAAPWQTVWAYIAYAVIAIALVLTLFRHQQKRLRREEKYARRLSREVDARTDELNQRNLDLKEASEAKSNFLARMSHEIRTPMNGVIGMTELLRGTDLTAKQKHFTRTISRSAEALLQIINDVLDLSKIEAGRFELEALQLDLSEIVDDAVTLLGPEASKKGIELVGFVDPELTLDLVGDPLRLRQVLINLVGNAIKFTADGEVTVRVVCESKSADQVSVKLEVSDTGIGIEDDLVQRIFDAFAQADESTTRRFGGTGLGLSICKQLVELMNGEMSVSSRPNVGSTFTCVIPFAVSKSQTVREFVDLSGMEVIVATPLRSLRDTISRRIAAHHASVIIVESSDDLSRSMAEDGVGVKAIIVDADSMDPDRVISEFGRHRNSQATRIILSSHAEMLSKEEILRHGSGDKVLTKPVRWPVLLDSLQRINDGRTTTDHASESGGVGSVAPVQGRILVVEDNTVNQLVAEGMLEELGCQVTLASDGRSGVAKATTEDFDVVLMDAQMPGMDGFEATRLIRSWEAGNRHVPIVGVTAHQSGDGRKACHDAGMDDYLAKPYVLEELAAVIRQWTSKSLQPKKNENKRIVRNQPSNVCSLDNAILNGIRSLQTDDRPDLLDRIFAAYLDGSRKRMNELAEARQLGSLSKMGAIAHALKSSSGNIGATEFSSLASELEKACDNLDKDSALVLAQRMEAMYVRVVDAVQDTLNVRSA
ncbi:MAG: two-component regulator propeller domain-containing protein [Woeseiaceae bacterium]